jgi:hypothetical protein
MRTSCEIGLFPALAEGCQPKTIAELAEVVRADSILLCVGILVTETRLQILQLKLKVQPIGSRVTGTWIYRGLMPALLKQLDQFNASQLHFLHSVCPQNLHALPDSLNLWHHLKYAFSVLVSASARSRNVGITVAVATLVGYTSGLFYGFSTRFPYSGYLLGTTVLIILSIYMGPVACQVDYYQAIQSILFCACITTNIVISLRKSV